MKALMTMIASQRMKATQTFIAKHHKTASVVLFWMIALAAFWFSMAPIQLGGRYLYVIVTGNSMEPYLHDGDMVVVTPGDDYGIGDVVVYRHPKLGTVIHRIISVEGNRYVIQGDHNDWIDSYQPSAAEIEGKLWFHVAYLGKVIEGFRSPIGAALLAGVIGLTIFWPERKPQESQ
jgi:signal peptidase I